MGVAESHHMNLDQADEVRESLLSILRHSPRQYGIARSRWRLADLLDIVAERLQLTSVSGIWRVLQRLNIRYRRGWAHCVSPDPLAEIKLAIIEQVRYWGQTREDEVVVLWLDELTVYRLPSEAPVWGDGTGRAPKARQSSGNNTTMRIGSVVCEQTGQLTSMVRSTFGKVQLRLLYERIRQVYPHAKEIYVIQDCWPVHFLTEVTQAATRYGITLVPLPTYSSWRNPIEKVWRLLKQDVTHMHPWTDQWQRLRHEVIQFLRQFDHHNSRLLRYMGLST